MQHVAPVGKEAPGASSLRPNCCACPVCGGTVSVDFFEAQWLPVHVGIFGSTQEEAFRLPTGDVVLSYCRDCGFIHNRVFDPGKLDYKPGYEVALHHSATFRRFMDGVAARLMERFDLHNKRIIEIGCGCAYFLSMLAELGGNDCIGYDPTVKSEGIVQVGGGRLQLVRDYFGPQHTVDADLVCCLSVFEHIPNPGDFLRMLRSGIEDKQPAIYFEVFNALQAIRNQEIWSIHYEQVNYFSRQSLARCFCQAGFRILDADVCYEGGQYVFVEATPAEGDPYRPREFQDDPAEVPEEIAAFADHHRARVAEWTGRLEEYRQTGRRVVVWGSGGKGIGFLNALATQDVIRYVVEINPDKHGQFIPGSGQEIVPPEFLADYQPQTIIITNALYEKEMTQRANELGVECEFLIA